MSIAPPGQRKPSLVWDMTMSWNEHFRDDVTLPRFRAAGFDVVGLTVASDRMTTTDEAQAGISFVRALVDREPERYAIASSTDAIRAAQRDGKLALEMHFQGSRLVAGDFRLVEHFYSLGVRHMGLIWNDPSPIGSTSTRGEDEGLTALGRDLVLEMNRVGMIVDGAHASYRTVMEAIEICQAPFVISHGNVHALVPSYKNARDDQIKACASTGGVIGISGFGSYLDDVDASSESMFRHIDHIAELVGIEHVGLGLDFVTDIPKFWGMVRERPHLWPSADGGPMAETDFFPPERVRELVQTMQSHGYAPIDIDAVLGENWFRVCETCWK